MKNVYENPSMTIKEFKNLNVTATMSGEQQEPTAMEKVKKSVSSGTYSAEINLTL